MYQAVLGATRYFRSISRAAIPFLLAHISKNTSSQTRSGTFDPWKIVPVIAENCFRHFLHCHKRRWLIAPVRVFLAVPSRGLMKLAPLLAQWGQTGVPSGHL